MSYEVIDRSRGIEVTFTISGWLRLALLVVLVSALAALGMLYLALGPGLRTLCLALPPAIGAVSVTWMLTAREYLVVDMESVTIGRRWLGREQVVTSVAIAHHRFESTDDPSFFAAAITPSQRVKFDGLGIGRRSLTRESARSLAARLNAFLDSRADIRASSPPDHQE